MCGIAGIIDRSSGSGINEGRLHAMTEAIAHRGPDGYGYFVDPQRRVGFGHRRLSIIDLAGGGQPMTDATGDLTIIFNGEIYNFPELKKELQQRGYTFRTSSDTEVVLCLYHAFGKAGFVRLNGIFAFAVFDRRNGDVILARDHFGVKPLYYAESGRTFLFGSEIKAVLASGEITPAVDLQELDTFLTLRYTPSPGTLFRSIHRLPPASTLTVSQSGEITVASYWEYAPHTDASISESDAIGQYQGHLERAVRRQMLSDVPVGLLLSGGIDSAVVGMIMRENSPEKLRTFSIGFEGTGDYNELDDARISARLIGSKHHEITTTREEYLDFLFSSFRVSEEPIAEPTIPALYYVSKLAAEHVKVVLAGQGADEPLAGYKRYFGEKYLAAFSPLLRMLPLTAIAHILPRNERFKRAAFASRFSDERDRFKAIYTIVTPGQKMRLLRPDVLDRLQATQWEAFDALYAKSGGLADSLAKILFIDTRMYLSDDLLIFGDKMSMAHSLEMRVPFLDIELIQFLERLPSSLKLKGRTHKYIHKKALTKWLPGEIIGRKKRGFATPIDDWFRSSLGDATAALVTGKGAAAPEYFSVPAILAMIRAHQSGKENNQRQLFALLSFELWHRTFIQNEIVEREKVLRES